MTLRSLWRRSSGVNGVQHLPDELSAFAIAPRPNYDVAGDGLYGKMEPWASDMRALGSMELAKRREPRWLLLNAMRGDDDNSSGTLRCLVEGVPLIRGLLEINTWTDCSVNLCLSRFVEE